MKSKTQTIELSSGVVLNIKQVPPMILAKVYNTLPEEPKPPKVFVEDLGREEENPNDPNYISAVGDYQMKLTDAITDAVIVFGTSLASTPAGFPTPYADYDEWAFPLSIIGIIVPQPRNEKDQLTYSSWVKYVAAATQEDLENLIATVSEISGVSEKAVAQAADQFRGEEERTPDTGI